MRKAEDVMGDFMRTWNNMVKYQNVHIDPVNPNYDEIEKAFSEEKKIVATYEYNKQIEQDEEER